MKKINFDGFINSIEDGQIYSVIVRQHGEVIGEYHDRIERIRPQYSVTKSFTSTAVGMAVDEGLISLKDPVIKFFPEEYYEGASEKIKSLSVEDLLRMSMGHAAGYLMADNSWGTTPRDSVTEKNWVQYCFERPMPYNPGEKFIYDNSCAYILGVTVQRVTGMSLVEYLMPRLFEPLEIARPQWEKCPMGYNFGAGGLSMKASELSRFGQLYLQRGKWNGRQLISEEWIEKATAKHIDTSSKSDWGMGYGYQFWRGKHNSYRADGKYGQYCIVLEDKDAVITVNAHCNRVSRVMEALWAEIWTQL